MPKMTEEEKQSVDISEQLIVFDVVSVFVLFFASAL